MNIIISNVNGEPIYLQIANQIKKMILDGELSEGDMLPSMRTLAIELRISFMTTKRAYEELEHEGFIESYTGKGSFVKAKTLELFREARMKEIDELLIEACEKAKRIGLGMKDLHDMLDMAGGDEDHGCV